MHRRDVVARAGARRRRCPTAPTTPPLRPRGQKTRQLLLDAGAVVLPARGYHDARVDDIVEAAGVSHGSFYRYFDNKDDFFRVLAEEASTRMVELLDAFPLDAPEPRAAGVARRLVRHLREQRRRDQHLAGDAARRRRPA